MLNNIKRKLETKFPQESKLLEVRHIKDLGYGVFAKQIIKEKQSIGIYEGEKIRIKNDEEVQSDYVYSIGKAKDVENVPEDYSLGFRGIDAKRFDSCFGRYINHPPIGFEKNIVSFTRDDIIELRACKEIQVGEQLFLDYGYNYWEGLAMRIVKGHVKKKQLYTDLANEALIQTIDPREPEDSDSDSDSDFSNKKNKKKEK
jgi:SET domain-containing protein